MREQEKQQENPMKRVKAKKELTVKDLDQLELEIFGDVSKPPIVSPEIVAEIEREGN